MPAMSVVQAMIWIADRYSEHQLNNGPSMIQQMFMTWIPAKSVIQIPTEIIIKTIGLTKRHIMQQRFL